MIWVGFTLMTAVAILFTVWPIFGKGRRQVVVTDGSPAVLVDQLDEVQRDFDRRLISEDEVSAARLEIKRRILAMSRRTAGTGFRSSGGGNAAIIVIAVFIPIFAAGFYAINGAPGVSSLAFANRQTERAQENDIAELIQRLFNRLSDDPTGGPSDGWMLLGQTYMRVGQFEGAVQAFEIVSTRDDATSATLSMLAEAMINTTDGIVSLKANAAIEKSLELDPTNPAAIFYKAMAMDQAGQSANAHDLLIGRLNQSDGFAPWMEVFIAEANRLGSGLGRAPLSLANFAPLDAPGPSASDVAAAGDMSAGDRVAFIRSMVDRLATRLEDEPDDFNGWMRLANAYTVLDERENAISAYKKAINLLQDAPKNDPRRLEIERALSKLEG